MTTPKFAVVLALALALVVAVAAAPLRERLHRLHRDRQHQHLSLAADADAGADAAADSAAGSDAADATMANADADAAVAAGHATTEIEAGRYWYPLKAGVDGNTAAPAVAFPMTDECIARVQKLGSILAKCPAFNNAGMLGVLTYRTGRFDKKRKPILETALAVSGTAPPENPRDGLLETCGVVAKMGTSETDRHVLASWTSTATKRAEVRSYFANRANVPVGGSWAHGTPVDCAWQKKTNERRAFIRGLVEAADVRAVIVTAVRGALLPAPPLVAPAPATLQARLAAAVGGPLLAGSVAVTGLVDAVVAATVDLVVQQLTQRYESPALGPTNLIGGLDAAVADAILANATLTTAATNRIAGDPALAGLVVAGGAVANAAANAVTFGAVAATALAGAKGNLRLQVLTERFVQELRAGLRAAKDRPINKLMGLPPAQSNQLRALLVPVVTAIFAGAGGLAGVAPTAVQIRAQRGAVLTIVGTLYGAAADASAATKVKAQKLHVGNARTAAGGAFEAQKKLHVANARMAAGVAFDLCATPGGSWGGGANHKPACPAVGGYWNGEGIDEVYVDGGHNRGAAGNVLGQCAGSKLAFHAAQAGVQPQAVVCMAEMSFRMAPVTVVAADNSVGEYAAGAMVPSCATCQFAIQRAFRDAIP